MPSIRKSALVPYSSERMFALVTDVPAYPQFLPWCSGAAMQAMPAGGLQPDAAGALVQASRLEPSAGVPSLVEAALQVDFYGLKLGFTTRNAHQPPHRVDMLLVSGPFRSLAGCWQFRALAIDACKIEFSLDYVLNSGLVSGALAPVFGQIAETMVDAFVRRAEAVHG